MIVNEDSEIERARRVQAETGMSFQWPIRESGGPWANRDEFQIEMLTIQTHTDDSCGLWWEKGSRR